MGKAALLLLPNVLGEQRHAELFLPISVFRAVETLDGLIAESEGEGRRYLKRFDTKRRAEDIPLALLNEHTSPADYDFLLEPICHGERWGLISDAGLPCIADPGSSLVWRARQRGISVQAFVGPSSLMLALMLSGLPSQQFAFHGYFPRGEERQYRQLQRYVTQSREEGSTHLFIETPYRNQQTLTALCRLLPDEAYLSVAWDLTLPTQGVMTQSIASWKRCTPPQLEKRPAVFAFAWVAC